jgi:hypothetical protein
MGQAVAGEKKPRPSLAGFADQGGTSMENEMWLNGETYVPWGHFKTQMEAANRYRDTLKAIAKLCSEGGSITPDWGFGSATIVLKDGSHTHIGGDWSEDEDENFNQFANGLHALLCEDKGLSFAAPEQRGKTRLIEEEGTPV